MNLPVLPRTPVTSTLNAPTVEKLKIIMYCLAFVSIFIFIILLIGNNHDKRSISETGILNTTFLCFSISYPIIGSANRTKDSARPGTITLCHTVCINPSLRVQVQRVHEQRSRCQINRLHCEIGNGVEK